MNYTYNMFKYVCGYDSRETYTFHRVVMGCIYYYKLSGHIIL